MNALSGLGIQLSAMLLLLGAVAWALLRLGRGATPKSGGPLELLARLPLDGRKSIYLVRAGQRVLVVGSSESGLSQLSAFDAHELEQARASSPTLQNLQAADLEARTSRVNSAED
jgi:flagellar biosynthetic protein FliO